MDDLVEGDLLDKEIVRGIQMAFDADESGAFDSLVGEFLDTSESSLQSIEAAVANENWGEAQRVAHRLKGMSFQLGALALGEASRSLEQALSDSPSSNDLKDHIRTMKGILHRTACAYRQFDGDVALH
jgi:HPt (histidine-containing phosphotransfer) domain-containing protein